MEEYNPVSRIFEAARRRDAVALAALIRGRAYLSMARTPGGETLIEFARRTAEELLTVLRAEADALWRAAGLPVERRDNFTMTELTVRDTAATPLNVIISPVPAGELTTVETFLRTFAAAGLERSRSSGDLTLYRFDGALESNIHDPAIRSTCHAGYAVGQTAGIDLPARCVVELLTAARVASSHFRGPYNQIGYAHAILREMMAREGISDAGVALLEWRRYWEGTESDRNIVEIQIAAGG